MVHQEPGIRWRLDLTDAQFYSCVVLSFLHMPRFSPPNEMAGLLRPRALLQASFLVVIALSKVLGIEYVPGKF